MRWAAVRREGLHVPDRPPQPGECSRAEYPPRWGRKSPRRSRRPRGTLGQQGGPRRAVRRRRCAAVPSRSAGAGCGPGRPGRAVRAPRRGSRRGFRRGRRARVRPRCHGWSRPSRACGSTHPHRRPARRSRWGSRRAVAGGGPGAVPQARPPRSGPSGARCPGPRRRHGPGPPSRPRRRARPGSGRRPGPPGGPAARGGTDPGADALGGVAYEEVHGPRADGDRDGDAYSTAPVRVALRVAEPGPGRELPTGRALLEQHYLPRVGAPCPAIDANRSANSSCRPSLSAAAPSVGASGPPPRSCGDPHCPLPGAVSLQRTARRPRTPYPTRCPSCSVASTGRGPG